MLKKIISSYKGIIAKDGLITKNELMEMLKLDEDISNKYKKDKILNDVADEILLKFTATTETIVKRSKAEKDRDRMKLYEQGLNDYEIADLEGVKQTTIWNWRAKRNLPIISTKHLKEQEANKERMKLYEQGLSDMMIAVKTDTNKENIRAWRISRGLPSNRATKVNVDLRKENKRFELLKNGMTAKEIAAVENVEFKTIHQFFRRHGMGLGDKR